MFFSPLEQFSVFVIYPITLGVFDLSFTSLSFTMLILTYFFMLIIDSSLKNFFMFNLSLFQNILEFFYNFTKGIMTQQTTMNNIPYVPLAFTVFLFVLICNFSGLSAVIPTSTSQFAVTASLAFSINLSFLLLAFQIQGVKFFKFFVPVGIPSFLVPFMVIIEIFSYSIRSISLFVRLFANMMAGHTLLHIIGSFFLVVYLTFNYYLAMIPFFLLAAIYVLEIAIAFLQAYVFLTLFCIYLNDGINAAHLYFPI